MRTTAERLRWWIAGVAAVLLVAISIYVILGRVKQRILRHDLPERLGVNIQQDSNGFTLSKSQEGRTLFTLHAARALQYKAGGEAKLHDVSIVFYGRGPHPREDRIRGQSFSYDQATGVVKADGQVDIDLQPPVSNGESPEDAAKNVIHLRTSGLIFEQKTGRAYTSQLTEFRLPQAEGTAVGAEYDSRDGVLQLLSQVRLHTTMQGDPVTVEAARATLRRNDVSEETREAAAAEAAKVMGKKDAAPKSSAEQGEDKLGQVEMEDASLHSPTRDLRAGHALIWMRPDGIADHAEFSAQVVLTTATGSQVEAARAQATMNQAGRIEHIHAEGGVKFSQKPVPANESAKAQRHLVGNTSHAVKEDGQAEQLWLDEDAHSQPTHLRMLGSVQIVQQPAAQPVTWTRQLNAGDINVAFIAGQPHVVTATQSPVMRETTQPRQVHGKDKGPVTKTMRADRLDTTLHKGRQPETLVGAGNTELVQTNAAETETSRGDHLEVKFDDGAVKRADAQKSLPAESGDTGQVQSAVQQGHVTLVRTAILEKPPAGKATTIETSRGWADRADYEQSDETVTLTGSPRLEDSGSANGTFSLAAKQVTLNRSTGDALAIGTVQTTQRQQPESAPTHIISSQAKLSHTQKTALFTGSARLWQGQNAIEAPAILLTQSPQALEATSTPSQRVRSSFVSRGQRKYASEKPVKVEADKLVYSDVDRRAQFSSQVVLTDGDATVRAERADVFLRPVATSATTNTASSKSLAGDLSGQVDRVTASGLVSLEQPGRRGTCENLVYTTADGRFVLTGSAARPPRIEDSQKGTVTGDTLIFLSRDDRVEVHSGGGNGASGRTLTTTHAAK